ncbi:MAG TPA: DNA repair protein RecN [Gemmatimonadaceae bacterium]|nr:DNA repair protein RecN [Gemmatimonadaceae bacterium]
MLSELRIRDFAIIDSLVLPFAPGFNVLSGETGAGKSIIVGALSVLVGERASTDLIRSGATKATVEGVFAIDGRPELREFFDARGVDVDDATVVLKREISTTRTRAWANGTSVTASVLAELGRALVNIHGQHEAQSLMSGDAQRRILDAFAGATTKADALRTLYERAAALRREREGRDKQRADARKREDWLRHVVRELEDAKLKPGEDASLSDELRRLSHAEELRRLSADASRILDGDGDAVVARLSEVRRALAALIRIDPSLSRMQEAFDAAFYQSQELGRDLAAYAESAESDPERLASVERRRDTIYRLIKKYGGTEETALEQLSDARRELALVDDESGSDDALKRDVAAADAALTAAATALTAERTRAAEKLGREVERVLPSLGLAEGRFTVTVRPLSEIGPEGAEEIELGAALNVGHASRPLARIASGGELSRVMLALKTILARLDRVPTLVFDEVDAGIGGAVALRVGDAMRAVADHHQVFAITHLAQIAARAHHHIVVEKGAKGGVATADTRNVVHADREHEIARMLGGDPESSVSREHARELIASAAETETTASATSPKAARTRAAKPGRR